MNSPYTYRTVHNGFVRKATYEIMFEGAAIRKVSGVGEQDVRDMVFLFNTAYDQGYCEGYRQGRFDATPV